MISRYVFIITVFLFLLLIGTGPIPIKILGVKLDYLISILLILLILNKANYRIKINKFGSILIIYFILILPSVIFSDNIIISFEKYIYALGYAFLAYIFTMDNVSERNYWELCKISIIAIFISCSLILFLYCVADYVGEIRFRIILDINKPAKDIDLFNQSVDPNMTAMGLIFLFLFALLGIIKSKIMFKEILMISLISSLIFVLLILQSRTAFVMLFLATLMFFIVKSEFKINYTYIFVLGLALLLILFSQSGELFSLMDRFRNATEYESQSTGRFDLIANQFHILLSSYKNILVGNGYMLSNPHNEYLRNLFDSGIFGFLGFIFLIFSLIFIVVRNSKIHHGNNLFAWVTLIPYLFSLAVYGHTKSLWMGAALCLIVSKVKFNNRYNQVLNNMSHTQCPKK